MSPDVSRRIVRAALRLHDAHILTREEAFVMLTRVLINCPELLAETRSAVASDAYLGAEFEDWLADLTPGAELSFGTLRFTVSSDFVALLDEVLAS